MLLKCLFYIAGFVTGAFVLLSITLRSHVQITIYKPETNEMTLDTSLPGNNTLLSTISLENIDNETISSGVGVLRGNTSSFNTDIREVDKSLHTRIIVCVFSAPRNTAARDTIRKTWALVKPNNTEVMFVLGLRNLNKTVKKTIEEENDLHRDLILLPDFQDSFDNLTQKVIDTMKWVHKNVRFNYFMKVDDDTYLRLDMLERSLHYEPTMLYMGSFTHGGKIQKWGKYREPDKYICDKFVSYAHGRGYVLSKDLVEFIVDNAEKLRHFRNEDVSVGTWLAVLKINRKEDARFRLYQKSKMSSICRKEWILLHPTQLWQMERFNRSLYIKHNVC